MPQVTTRSLITSRARQVVGYTISGVLLAAGVAWAILLPSIRTCPSCPPGYPCHCVTNSRIPLRVVIAVGGLVLGLLAARLARPPRKVPWSED